MKSSRTSSRKNRAPWETSLYMGTGNEIANFQVTTGGTAEEPKDPYVVPGNTKKASEHWKETSGAGPEPQGSNSRPTPPPPTREFESDPRVKELQHELESLRQKDNL